MTDEHAPPGWEKNPSAKSARHPQFVLAIAGFLVASYLALFQLGVVDTVWEPFFGDGTRIVLTSELAQTFPVPDASLGAAAYLFEAITDEIGGEERWHRRPWVVLAFGAAVCGLGATSVVLVIVQPVVLDTWCTLCLASAAISISLVGPATDEVLASLQYLRRAHDEGESLRDAVRKGTRATASMPIGRGS